MDPTQSHTVIPNDYRWTPRCFHCSKPPFKFSERLEQPAFNNPPSQEASPSFLLEDKVVTVPSLSHFEADSRTKPSGEPRQHPVRSTKKKCLCSREVKQLVPSGPGVLRFLPLQITAGLLGLTPPCKDTQEAFVRTKSGNIFHTVRTESRKNSTEAGPL